MTTIKQCAHGDKQLEEDLAEGFRLIMEWPSPKTMETYIHTPNKRKALLEIFLEDEKQQDDQAAQSEMRPPLTEDSPLQRGKPLLLEQRIQTMSPTILVGTKSKRGII